MNSGRRGLTVRIFVLFYGLQVHDDEEAFDGNAEEFGCLSRDYKAVLVPVEYVADVGNVTMNGRRHFSELYGVIGSDESAPTRFREIC